MLYAGVDLGQRQDHSAIAVVVERRDLQNGLTVKYVERVALGTPYGDVVERVREVVRASKSEGGCCLAVDGTGLGAPVVEMLRGAGLGCEVTAVFITGGSGERRQGSGWCVPKQDLLAGVQVLLEKRELRIAGRMREARALMRELVDVRMRVGGAGRVKLGADGSWGSTTIW